MLRRGAFYSRVLRGAFNKLKAKNEDTMKRRRNMELEEEFSRQKSCLNRTFSEWVQSNLKANPVSFWEDGANDYIAYATQLESRCDTSGHIYSFGTGDCGQLGHGVEEGDRDMFVLRPRKLDNLKNEVASGAAAGGMHNGVLVDGALWTWGCGDNDCLGREGDENYAAPVESLRHTYIVQVSLGDCHTAALDLYGRVYVWGTYKDRDGKNFFPAQSVEGSFGRTQMEPFLVNGPSSEHGCCKGICSGSSHTLALCGDGTVYSWGIGDSGQLGRDVCELKDDREVYRKQDIFHQHLTATVMQYDDGMPVDNARYIEAGNHHSFVIQAVRSRVFGCGLNQYSQLGISNKNVIDKLTHVDSLKNILAVYGGEHSSLAITHSGQVLTFGRSDNNQLGVSNLKDEAGAFTAIPQHVKIDKRIVSGACGSFHCAVVAEDGSTYTWGFGESGQLGHGKERGTDYPHDEKLPKLLMNHKTKQPIIASLVAAGAQHTIILVKE